MKLSTYALAANLMLILSAGVAHAGDRSERGDRAERQPPRDNRVEMRQPDRVSNQERQLEAESRPTAADIQFQAESGKRFGHLTADERRALRRQINEAGQDIYSRKR